MGSDTALLALGPKQNPSAINVWVGSVVKCLGL